MKPHRQRFEAHDEITIRGVRYRWRGRSGDGHDLERLDQPTIVEHFSDERLAEEVRRPDYARRRGHLGAARANVRRQSGLDNPRDLPADERRDVDFRVDVVERFLALHDRGEVVKTYDGADDALRIIASDLEAERRAHSVVPAGERKPRIDSVRAAAIEDRGDDRPMHLPCGKILLEWTRRYLRGGRERLALRDGRHASGCKSRLHGAEVRRLVCEAADGFMSRLQPTMENAYEDLRIAVGHLNEARVRDGLEKVRCPSIKFLSKEIKGRRAVRVHAARHGADEAEKIFKPLGEGLDVSWVGQRVEMDEWPVAVISLLQAQDVWPKLDDDMRATAVRARLYACTAIDAASRVPLGIALSRQQNSAENCLACLAMVVTDKTRLAEWAGAEMPWSMACVPDLIVTDNGSGFRSGDFKAAGAGLGSRVLNTIAGKSNMRGREERLYHTIEMQVCGRTPGRTFANPVERGDYDSGESAVLFDAMMLRILVVYLVDKYSNSPHRGLHGEPPIDAYERLVDEYGVNSDPGLHIRREALGIDLTCDLDRHGVRKFNLTWTSDELQDLFRDRGSHEVAVRFDPTDLGWVSVQVRGEWVSCPCRRDGMDGMSLAAWEQVQAERRRRNKGKAREREPVALRAVEKIKAMVDGENERFGLGGPRATAEQLELIERRMLDGFVAPGRRDDDEQTMEDAFAAALPTGGAVRAPRPAADDGTGDDAPRGPGRGAKGRARAPKGPTERRPASKDMDKDWNDGDEVEGEGRGGRRTGGWQGGGDDYFEVERD